MEIPTTTPMSSQIDQEAAFKINLAGRRILLYTECAGIYGVAQCNHQLLCALVATGYRVTVAQPKEETHIIQQQRLMGITHYWLQDDNLYDRARPARALTDDSEARQIFSRMLPDLVIFANGSPMSNLKPMQAAGTLGIAYIVIVHCVALEWVGQYRPYLAVLPDIFRHAREVVAVSNDNLVSLQRFFGLPSARGRVIYNGRPDEFFREPSPKTRADIRREFRIPSDAVVSLTTARLEYIKGHDLQIMAAIKLLRGVEESKLFFLWAGRGSLEKRLRFLTRALGIAANIRFVGERADIVNLYDAADIFVLPSRYEGMPLAVIEAMAKGLPVAASAVSGTPEALGATGVLLPDPNRDAKQTIDALVDVLDLWATDATARHAAGVGCWQRAQDEFQLTAMVRKYQVLIERHIGG